MHISHDFSQFQRIFKQSCYLNSLFHNNLLFLFLFFRINKLLDVAARKTNDFYRTHFPMNSQFFSVFQLSIKCLIQFAKANSLGIR